MTATVTAWPKKAQFITPSDTLKYERPVSIEVHVAGDVKVLPWDGDFSGGQNAITIPAAIAVAGYQIPFEVRRVYATGTTSTSLLGTM